MTGRRTIGKPLKIRNMIIYIVLALLVGAAAFFRLAPSDPAKWHTDPGTIAATDCRELTTTASSARVTCIRAEDPLDVLATLDSIALASVRTVRLAGSAETGRITWVSRSLIWGFPDYTTAQATAVPEGTRLDILARPRFGESDLGVNAKRLTAWLAGF
jgi:hypothetical protein